MKESDRIPGIDHQKAFKVPDGYFETFEKRLMDKIREEENQGKTRKFPAVLRPYFSLAASMAGIALVTYMVLKTLPDTFTGNADAYSIELIDDSGIMLDESVIAESYSEAFSDDYTDWEEEAMVYLASNEVDLLLLLEE